MGTRIGQMNCPTCKRQTSGTQTTCNHLLHLVLTLCTCGGWVCIWALMAFSPGPMRCNVCGSMRTSDKVSDWIVRGLVYGFVALIVLTFLIVAIKVGAF